MASSQPRSADASIAGYLYQFDKSILEVLRAPADGIIVLEGCEDVDLLAPDTTTAVQCKYHAKRTFSLRALREPLLAMLRSFGEGLEYEYRLYVHFGEKSEQIPERLSLSDLKTALTKNGQEKVFKYFEDFPEQVLQRFIQQLRIIAGPTLEVQRDEVLASLCEVLGAVPADATGLHYPTAISVILDRASNPDEEKRTINRSWFINAIDQRESMFTRWHRDFLGAENYLKTVSTRIQALELAKSTFRRMVVLGHEELKSASSTIRLSDLIIKIGKVRFGVGHLPQARPWTIILDAPEEEVKQAKEDLLQANIVFQDGFEHLCFRPDIFDRPVIANTGTQNKKVSATAYDLRLAALSTVEAHISSLRSPDVLMSFRDEPIHLDWTAKPRELNVAGCDLEQLAELFGRL